MARPKVSVIGAGQVGRMVAQRASARIRADMVASARQSLFGRISPNTVATGGETVSHPEGEPGNHRQHGRDGEWSRLSARPSYERRRASEAAKASW